MRGPDDEDLSINPSANRSWTDACGRVWELHSFEPDHRRVKTLCKRPYVLLAVVGHESEPHGWLTDPERKTKTWADLRPRTWAVVEGDYTARVTEWRSVADGSVMIMLEQFC